MTKIVKIYPKEYWDDREDGCYVDNKKFLSGLDNNIEECGMQKYFGTIQEVTVVEEFGVPGREKYFFIESWEKTQSNDTPGVYHCYEWDLCAIQEELKREDYPEYYL